MTRHVLLRDGLPGEIAHRGLPPVGRFEERIAGALAEVALGLPARAPLLHGVVDEHAAYQHHADADHGELKVGHKSR